MGSVWEREVSHSIQAAIVAAPPWAQVKIRRRLGRPQIVT